MRNESQPKSPASGFELDPATIKVLAASIPELTQAYETLKTNPQYSLELKSQRIVTIFLQLFQKMLPELQKSGVKWKRLEVQNPEVTIGQGKCVVSTTMEFDALKAPKVPKAVAGDLSISFELTANAGRIIFDKNSLTVTVTLKGLAKPFQGKAASTINDLLQKPEYQKYFSNPGHYFMDVIEESFAALGGGVNLDKDNVSFSLDQGSLGITIKGTEKALVTETAETVPPTMVPVPSPVLPIEKRPVVEPPKPAIVKPLTVEPRPRPLPAAEAKPAVQPPIPAPRSEPRPDKPLVRQQPVILPTEAKPAPDLRPPTKAEPAPVPSPVAKPRSVPPVPASLPPKTKPERSPARRTVVPPAEVKRPVVKPKLEPEGVKLPTVEPSLRPLPATASLPAEPVLKPKPEPVSPLIAQLSAAPAEKAKPPVQSPVSAPKSEPKPDRPPITRRPAFLPEEVKSAPVSRSPVTEPRPEPEAISRLDREERFKPYEVPLPGRRESDRLVTLMHDGGYLGIARIINDPSESSIAHQQAAKILLFDGIKSETFAVTYKPPEGERLVTEKITPDELHRKLRGVGIEVSVTEGQKFPPKPRQEFWHITDPDTVVVAIYKGQFKFERVYTQKDKTVPVLLPGEGALVQVAVHSLKDVAAAVNDKATKIGVRLSLYTPKFVVLKNRERDSREFPWKVEEPREIAAPVTT